MDSDMQQQEKSHLSTLIERVRADEATFNYATKEHLINIAEYILTWPNRYSRSEYDQAIQTLAFYHMAPLAARRIGWQLIEKELAKSYVARCRRCGVPISSKVSLAVGYGHVCRKKLGIIAKDPLLSRTGGVYQK
jgi:hypothetical protein